MSQPKEGGAGRRREALLALALAVLALVAYAPVLRGGYQFINADDDEYVTANPHVQAGLTGPSVWWALTAFHSHNWHPLTWMSLQLDWQLYGRNPLGFHLTNVLLHAANAALLFLVLRWLTGAVWRSAAVAAFFAVHPLHVESVAWVAERKDMLSTLFWLLTLGAYAAYAARPGWGRYLLTLALFALGLTAKPMLVTLPCVLLLLDYWPLRRFDPWKGDGPRALAASAGRLLAEKVPFFALAAGCSLLTLQAQQDIMPSLDTLPWPYRLGNVPLAYVRYIGLMVWPARLTVFYQHPGVHLSFGLAAAAAGFLLAVTALALAQARRRPYLAVGWLWYLGTLVPVIGLVQVGRQALADRYTYIPLIGLFVLLAWGAEDLLGRRRLARLAAVPTVAALLAACLVLTWRQLPYWRNSTVLWQHALTVDPEASIAHQGLAKALEEEGHIDEARREYADCVRFDPGPVAHNDVGVFLARHGWPDEALEHFAQTLALYPDHARAHYNMGRVLLRQGKVDEARQHLAEAARLLPGFVDAHYYLALALERQGKFREAQAELALVLSANPGNANALYHLGVALQGRGQSGEAGPCFASALEKDPGHVEAHTSLGALLAAEGELAAARQHFTAALDRDPRYAGAHYNLALALELDGQFAEAGRHFAEAVSAAPDDADARHHLGVALIRQGQYDEARPHLAEAVRLRPRAAAFHDSLGLALEALGQTEAALAEYRQAVALDADRARSHANVALLLRARGEADAAADEYRAALHINPGWPDAARRTAWVLATHPEARMRNGFLAAHLARQACQAAGSPGPESLDTLAAAQAEQGQFAAAARMAAEARAAAAGKPDLARQIEARRRLYEQHQPYRDETATTAAGLEAQHEWSRDGYQPLRWQFRVVPWTPPAR
jgi:tetratricopeptide (TPR) repeat protein